MSRLVGKPVQVTENMYRFRALLKRGQLLASVLARIRWNVRRVGFWMLTCAGFGPDAYLDW